MLKMLVILWHLLQMEVNLLYGVLELVLRTRPRDKNIHAGSVPSSEEPTKKKKKQSFTEEREKRMTELVASLRERHELSIPQFSTDYGRKCLSTKLTKRWIHPHHIHCLEKKSDHVQAQLLGSLNEALTGLANSIAIALVPNQLQQSASSSSTASPTKTAQLRSKYMEQLKKPDRPS